MQTPEEGEGWQKAKKGKTTGKSNEKKAAGHTQDHTSSSSKSNQEASNLDPVIIPNNEEIQISNEPAGKELNSESTKRKQIGSQSANREATATLEPGEIPQTVPDPSLATEALGSTKEASAEHLPDSDPGEESDEGASSSSLHIIPIKNPRGRCW